jgi:hypothetical protein
MAVRAIWVFSDHDTMSQYRTCHSSCNLISWRLGTCTWTTFVLWCCCGKRWSRSISTCISNSLRSEVVHGTRELFSANLQWQQLLAVRADCHKWSVLIASPLTHISMFLLHLIQPNSSAADPNSHLSSVSALFCTGLYWIHLHHLALPISILSCNYSLDSQINFDSSSTVHTSTTGIQHIDTTFIPIPQALIITWAFIMLVSTWSPAFKGCRFSDHLLK